MKLNNKAKQYAEVMFKVASQSDSEMEVKDSLFFLSESIKNFPELRSFLLSKRVSNIDKSNAIKAIFSDKCHIILSEFIAMVEKINIVKLIPLLEKYFIILLIEENNIVSVSADIAENIDENKKNDLKSIIDKALNKDSELSFHVNPKLLGGIRLRVGNELIDASIINHLNKLRHEMLGAK